MPSAHRRSISVRRKLHAALVDLGRARDRSVCGTLEDIMLAELERLGCAPAIKRRKPQGFTEHTRSPARRRSLSVHAAVYDALSKVAESRGVLLTTLVDNFCCAAVREIGIAIERVGTPSRAYRREGRPRRPEPELPAGPVSTREHFEQPWHGGYLAL